MMPKVSFARKMMLALGVSAAVSLFFTGCESLDSGNGQAYPAAAGNRTGNAAGGQNAFAQGRAVPPLSGADRALYDKAVELYRSERNNPALFDTAGAIPCELNEQTKYLLAYRVSQTAFEIMGRRSDRVSNMKTQNEPLEVSVLAGRCADGKIEGSFDIVTKLVSNVQMQTGTYRMVVTQRVRGTMSDGTLNGPFSVMRRTESEFGGAVNAFWGATEAVLRDNEQVGSSVTYNELAQFNATVVATPLANGFIQMRAYNGSVLGSVMATYQGQSYGPMLIYADGKPSSSAFYWAGRPVTDPEYLRTPLTKPLVTAVGVGLTYPQNLSGAFDVVDVVYPSPASAAGLLPGDTVTAIGGLSLNAGHNAQTVQQALAGEEGSEVTIEFTREGEAEPRLAVVRRGSFKTPRPGR